MRTAIHAWLWKRRRARAARLAFGLLASCLATIRARSPRRVWIEGDTLVREWSDGFIVTRPDYGYMSPSEAREEYCFAYTPRPGDTVVDVGAGLGDTTRFFSSLVGPTGRVVAIEAHPGPFACLTRMIELNLLRNVEPVQAALTGEAGSVSLTDDLNWKQNRMVGAGEAIGAITVPGLTLDTLCEAREISEIALLKINIEGAEAPATRGMQDAIDRCQSVVISSHDFKADSTGDESFRTKAIVSRFLHDHGFEVVTRVDHPVPWIRDQVYGVRPPGSRAAGR